MKDIRRQLQKITDGVSVSMYRELDWWKNMDTKYGLRWRLANVTLALFLLASAVLPVVQNSWQANRYALSSSAVSLVGKTNASLAKQLTYDATKQQYQFNKDAIASSDVPAMLQKNSAGAASKSNAKTY